MAAAWAISSYSEEKSTAFRPYETKIETFSVLVPEEAKNIRIQARIVSHHGLPVEFGKPEEGKIVLEKTLETKLE